MCFALDHLCVEWLRIQAGWKLTQDGLHSGVKTQSVSRELFDVYWGLSVVRSAPGRGGDWLQPQGQKAAGPAHADSVRKPLEQKKRAQVGTLSDMKALPLRGEAGRGWGGVGGQEGGLSVWRLGNHVYSGTFSLKMVQSQ